MKPTYFIIISFILTINTFAQSNNDIHKIALSVVMPENVDGLNVSQISKLETKIAQIVTISGLAATGYNNNFVIYPKFAIYESKVVEGGMQNITVVNAEISLFIKQVDINLLFSTISIPIKGSGSNKQLAITNAISSIQINNPEFESFIQTGKKKIIQYYEMKCEDIIKKSEAYVKMQQYKQALGLLMTVPEEVSSCYSQIQNKAIEAYKAYQTQNCEEQLQKAKSVLAANDYVGALDILADIDPSTNCFNEAKTLANFAASKVDTEERKQWNFKMKQYDNEVSLGRQRIEAIKDIAISYYKNQPKTLNYNYIVR